MAPTVQCFVGYFPDQLSFDAYIEEDYPDKDAEEEDLDTPISTFCEEQGEFFIDHDFMEARFIDDPATIRDSLAMASYAESFAQTVIQAFDSAPLPGLSNCQIYLTMSQK